MARTLLRWCYGPTMTVAVLGAGFAPALAGPPTADPEGADAASSEIDPRLAPPTSLDDITIEPGESTIETGSAAGGHAGPSWSDGRGSSDEGPVAPFGLHLGGAIASEVHYRAREQMIGSYYDQQVLPRHFARNENTLNLRINAEQGRFTAVGEIDFDWLGRSESIADLSALTRPANVSPYRLQAHALFVEGIDILTEGLDIRVGQQVVAWGVGDQFNPTNTINPSDLENVLFFGRQVANLMARVDYAWTDEWRSSAVVVPVFKPALLPTTAPLGLTAVDRLPFVSPELRYRLHSERELARTIPGDEHPTVVTQITPVLPEPRPENAQWAAQLAGSIGGQDLGFSYYYGRTDFPVPTANTIRSRDEEICRPDAVDDCIEGLIETDVEVRYPRVQVIGLNLTGEINPLGWVSDVFKPLGYRLELGLYVPRERRFKILQEDVSLLGLTRNGEYDYGLPDGRRPIVVESDPFAKWVVGLDYSLGRYVMLNAMWVHGLPDEYGAGDFFHEGWSVRQAAFPQRDLIDDCVLTRNGEQCAEELLRPRIGDYLVLGLDFNFADRQGLLRLFTLWDVGGIYRESWDPVADRRVREHEPFYSAAGRSAVLYPELQYNFGNGFSAATGAFWQVGEPYTKFGDPAAGGSMVWARATLSI